MPRPPLTAQAKPWRRLWAYLLERFPPAPYTLLVALFYGSAVLVCSRLSGIEPVFHWQAPVVILLLFFHLRVFDEQKDFAEDQQAHPDRLLSQGIVTLPFLTKSAIVAILVQAGLAASLGTQALLAWACCLLFTLTMRFEFGLGPWLNQHPLLYALTHNPITPLLGVFAWASTDAPWAPMYGWYLGTVAMGALAFELGRKIRLPDEEQEGVNTYSKSFGRKTACSWMLLASLLTIALAVPVIDVLAVETSGGFGRLEFLSYFFLVSPGIQTFSAALRGASAKGMENAGTAMLLGAFGAFGVIAW